MATKEDKHDFVGTLTNASEDLKDLIKYLEPAKNLEAHCAWEVPSVIAELEEIIDTIEEMVALELQKNIY